MMMMMMMKKLIHRQKNGELEGVLCELKNTHLVNLLFGWGLTLPNKQGFQQVRLQGPTLKLKVGGVWPRKSRNQVEPSMRGKKTKGDFQT
jgi:hypothetical protein